MTNSKDAELVFLPLGGCGEIGMNLNAYGYGPAHDRRWILIDVGVTFGGDDTPGIDLITPDPAFLEDQGDNIDAIFLRRRTRAGPGTDRDSAHAQQPLAAVQGYSAHFFGAGGAALRRPRSPMMRK